MQAIKLKMMILSSFFAAVIAVCAQISFYITPSVPLTLQTLAISLTAILLGSRYGTLSVLIYLLLGAFGFPVFAGMKGGFQVLAGPTGGYLIGFVVGVFVIGWIMERGETKLVRIIAANIVGLLIIYAIGVSMLKFVTQMDWEKAFFVGVVPFLVTDLVKLTIASVIGLEIRKRLGEQMGQQVHSS